MWMAPKIPAMQEQMDFQLRYMKKLFGNDTETMARDLAQAMAMYPQMKDGMERMKKEAAKLEGTPVLNTMKIEMVASPEQAGRSRAWRTGSRAATPDEGGCDLAMARGARA